MYDLIHNLETFLNSEKDNFLSRFKLKFCKSTTYHDEGDFKCTIPSFIDREALTPKFFSELVEKHGPWTKDLVKFELTTKGITLFLNRQQIFLSCVQSVLQLSFTYGNNDLFKGQFMTIEAETSSEDSLTDLRVKLVANVLSRTLDISGCIVVAKTDGTDRMNVLEGDTGDRDIPEPNNPVISLIVSPKPSYNCDKHVLIGHVVGQNGKISSLPVEQYLQLRREEVVGMCEHKSNEVTDCNDLEEAMLDIVVCFDLLHTTVCRTVALCLEEGVSDRPSCKGAVFVLYNYVRLAAICDKFDDQVARGYCPPLPPLDQIDFSLLSDDEEWKLMYDYVLYWPQIVKKSLQEVEKGRPKLHLIVSFLTRLAGDFSQYYRRTRILTEPRSHLLPVLYARIYLLKALKEVLRNALSILSIKPPTRM